MPLNHARYADRQKESASRSGTDSGNIFRLKEGKNYLRIFKFKHTVTKRDFEVGSYRKGNINSPKVGETVEELSRNFKVHLTKGQAPQMCFINKNNCSLCQSAQDYANDGETQASRQMRAQERDAINVVDTQDIKGGMKRIDLNPQPFGRMLEQYRALLEDGVEEDAIFGNTGRDFIITWDKEADIDKKYTVSIRDREKSEKLPNWMQQKVMDFYNTPDLDPQDAPPVGEQEKPVVSREEGDKPPWEDEKKAASQPAPAEPPLTKPAVHKKKVAHLQDSALATPKRIEFDDGEGHLLQAEVVEFGEKIKCSVAGEIWELDKTEKYVVLE